jgi:hypothetical protein
MRWLSFVPLVAAMGAGASVLTGAPPRPAVGPRYLLTDREAVILPDAALVSAPAVSTAAWSSDSRYVLAARQAMPLTPPAQQLPSGELSLVVWNRGTGRSQEIWKRPAGVQRVDQLDWLSHTHMALMVVGWIQPTPEHPASHRTLYWVDAVHGQTRALGELQSEQLLISPAQPQAVLFSRAEDSLRVIRADGSFGPVLPRSKGVDVTEWSRDGSTLLLRSWEMPAARNVPPLAKWHAMDLQTGAITTLAAAPEEYQEQPQPVRLKSSTAVLKEENMTQRVSPLWLESTVKSEQPRVLVCADGGGGSLAPDASAVLYLSQGAAWVVPLVRLPREQMLAQLRAAQRQEALSNARQIGLALSMYAQDYDETFPPADGHATQVLRPYLKNDEVFNAPGTDIPGFVYTYTGGPMKTITDPSTQEVGYLPGPGGRAVIFADGHAKWQSDNESPGPPAGGGHQPGHFR